MAQNQLLLLEDVDGVGRSGDLVKVKPGFWRNFLLPKNMAVIADKRTLRMQAALQEERAKRASIDRSEAEKAAAKINEMALTIEVKVDPDGHMYGSVTAQDIANLFEKEGVAMNRKNVVLPRPIKDLGIHDVNLRLKEGVPALFKLQVVAEPKKENV